MCYGLLINTCMYIFYWPIDENLFLSSICSAIWKTNSVGIKVAANIKL